MSGMTIRHGLTTLCAVPAAALLLAACGSGSGDGDTAGQPDDAARLAFAKCMRAAGVDFQETRPTGTAGGPTITRVRVPKGIPRAKMDRIQADCAKKTGGAPKPPSKEEQARFLDQALKFSRCMRAHGVDLPDPQASGGGGISIRRRGAGTGPAVNLDSPAFQRAQKACASFMPGGSRPAVGAGKGDGGGPALDSVQDAP